MRNLTDEDVNAIAKRFRELQKADEAKGDCNSFEAKERKWVHTGAEYIPTDKLPLLGKVLKMVDEAEYELGKWVLRSLFFLGFGSLVFWLLHRFGVTK